MCWKCFLRQYPLGEYAFPVALPAPPKPKEKPRDR